MRLTVLVIVIHILLGRERRLRRDVPALAARVGTGFAHSEAEDVGFAVLFE